MGICVLEQEREFALVLDLKCRLLSVISINYIE